MFKKAEMIFLSTKSCIVECTNVGNYSNLVNKPNRLIKLLIYAKTKLNRHTRR